MKYLTIILSFFSFLACQTENPPTQANPDEVTFRQLNKAYLQNWLESDEAGVLALFEADARISPSSLCPIDSIDNLKAFWFPNDGSKTTIHRFEAEELALKVLDTLGYSTQKTYLEWSYELGETKMGRKQEGIETTIFRKQADGSWKIWRKMWQDVKISER